MSNTSWVIMREYLGVLGVSAPHVYMIGFRSKQEAENECDRLNESEEHTAWVLYSISKAKVFQP